MPEFAIQVQNLSKQYRIGRQQQRHDTIRDSIAEAVKNLRWRNKPEAQVDSTIWALRDVSFEIRPGEVVGVIGRNGAGKSTLLKILSQITEPTSGRAVINGRVGSLLEVGTGFHPELTGRENIYLYGAILGMSREEIRHKFDAIVDFAEIDKFLDTPVKRYSSGMYVRLAFAVAAHLEPEILLVDEVLAVGDAAFQKKCLGKLIDVTQQGLAVIFVSHNLGAISTLTRACIYLRDGSIEKISNTKDCIEKYLADNLEQKTNTSDIELINFRRDLFDNPPIKIIDINIKDVHEFMPKIRMGQELTLAFKIKATKEITGANISIIFKNSRGEHITVIFSWDYNFSISVPPGNHVITAEIKSMNFTPGNYYIDAGINQTTATKAYDVIKDYPIFTIVNVGTVTHWIERPWGPLHIDQVSWEVTPEV